MKKLYRSKENKILTGLLGGVGEYFNIDPVWVRLGFVALALATEIVPGVLVYIVGYFLVPKAPESEVVPKEEPETKEE